MSEWRTIKAKHLLATLQRIGWSVKRQTGSHKILEKPGCPDVVFAFHDNEEICPKP
jgi:predicted RNA binding protein YcfA (HicA-like mRNA interferase family)